MVGKGKSGRSPTPRSVPQPPGTTAGLEPVPMGFTRVWGDPRWRRGKSILAGTGPCRAIPCREAGGAAIDPIPPPPPGNLVRVCPRHEKQAA